MIRNMAVAAVMSSLISLLGCSSEREEGRVQLIAESEKRLADITHINTYELDTAWRMLGHLEKRVRESSYADVKTFDTLTADIESLRNVLIDKQKEFDLKRKRGYSVVDGRLVSRDEKRAIRAAQVKTAQQERERKKAREAREFEQAKAELLAAAEAIRKKQEEHFLKADGTPWGLKSGSLYYGVKKTDSNSLGIALIVTVQNKSDRPQSVNFHSFAIFDGSQTMYAPEIKWGYKGEGSQNEIYGFTQLNPGEYCWMQLDYAGTQINTVYFMVNPALTDKVFVIGGKTP